MSAELLSLSAFRQAELIRAGEISGEEVFRFWRGRAVADRLGSYLWVADEDGGGRLPPVAVKDLFCVEDVPSTAGSRILENYLPVYTATAVRRLQEAGADVLGKTNQDEFGMGSSNENSGYWPVRNPWDPERVPGGTSGGSAAAVAAGSAPWALGTDTGGSVRQPGALCGVVGLKPTYGAISRHGIIAYASSLDQCAPLTRDVRDAAFMLGMLEGRDPCDSTSVGIAGGVPLPSAERLDGLRFGSWGLEAEGLDAGVAEVCRAAVGRIEELGGRVEEVELPSAAHGISAYYVIAPAEASANLGRYDGVRYGLRVPADDLDTMYELTRARGFGAEVKRRILVGTYALSSGYYEAYYGTAQRVRTKILREFQAAFERVDLVVTPTSPTVAFKLGERTADPLAMYLADYYTVPISLSGIPAISIPCGLSEGLPVGLQIAGPPFSEARILDAAHALERAFGFEGVPRKG